MKKNRSLIVGGLILIGMVIAIPILVNIAFDTPASFEFMVAKYSAGEFLSYIAASLAFIGTMFLGFVSYKQNRDLQKREDASFIAANSCMALVMDVTFARNNQKAVNLEEHTEPIVITDFTPKTALDYSSCECTIKLKTIDHYPAIVRVERLILNTTYKGEGRMLEFKRNDEHFSRVGIFDDCARFSVAMIMTPDQKKILDEQFRSPMMMNLLVEFLLVTDKGVATRLRCKSRMRGHVKGTTVEFGSSADSNMCFWYGNEIIQTERITYRGKGDIDNG